MIGLTNLHPSLQGYPGILLQSQKLNPKLWKKPSYVNIGCFSWKTEHIFQSILIAKIIVKGFQGCRWLCTMCIEREHIFCWPKHFFQLKIFFKPNYLPCFMTSANFKTQKYHFKMPKDFAWSYTHKHSYFLKTASH